jgi:NAD(P)-dependent dehydrogenase (short-subunit alcohol dehydrogenase family)
MATTSVVTGCSSGFGRDVSERLARTGLRVYATMRDVKGKNAASAAAFGDLAARDRLDVRVVDMDVTKDESVDAAAAGILAEATPDLLVNNAGQMFAGVAEAFTAAELTAQLDVNLVGPHRVTRAFLPAMRKRGTGLIINVSSTAGRVAVPFYAIYHASKWALEGYSMALRSELATSGIDVVVVEPGPCTTALFSTVHHPADNDGRAATYPAVVHETLASVEGMFDHILDDPATPTDPSMVVDRIVELVQMTPGTRPFRSVIGVDFGVRERNADVERHDAGLLEAAGLSSFARLKVR